MLQEGTGLSVQSSTFEALEGLASLEWRNTMPNQGGSHEQHVKAGQQSHKNMDKNMERDRQQGGRQQQAESGSSRQQGDNMGSSRGGSHEQHVKAGQQSHKND
jgi:hypothetical protein